MSYASRKVRDGSYFSTLFDATTLVLQESDGQGLHAKILVDAVKPLVGAEYEKDDIHDAIALLASNNVIERQDTGADDFIKLATT